MLERVTQRIATTGSIKLPAVPGLVDEYVRLCAAVFGASGRGFRRDELEQAKLLLAERLKSAFAGSVRSKIEIAFEAESARPLSFVVSEDVRSIPDAYERWVGSSDAPLFGAHPDARVLAVAEANRDPAQAPILDFGAGTGRNALGLARLGYPVDAVEITPKFVEILRQAAVAERLDVRVISEDVLQSSASLRRDYQLVFASEVVPDFRGVADLRQLFELAAEVLTEGGVLLFNVHLCAKGYNPERSARELAQQCYSNPYTPSEVLQAASGLPFTLTRNDSVLEYEREHLPPQLFPPTPWYVNWTKGLDVYELDDAQCPIEMRWLTFEKHRTTHSSSQATPGSVWLDGTPRARRFDPKILKEALVKRLVRRMSAAGALVLPAIPGMLDFYASQCLSLFRALGRPTSTDQTAEFRRHLENMLNVAFATSQRSNVVVSYEVVPGSELKYQITADPLTISEAYEQWHESLPEPMFGWHPDARVVALVSELRPLSSNRVLDVGAGLGRNSLYLAREGFSVDALEIAPKFVGLLATQVAAVGANVRVLQQDFPSESQELQPGYALALLSGTAGDFRDVAQLRGALELLSELVVDGGTILLNLHLAAEGYSPSQGARQWAQQCCALLLTREDLGQITAALPLALLSDESAYDFEMTRLPEDAWPPTPAFPEWALGRHLFAAERADCPVELRWLVYRRG